jgi:beta propeller repeat protein
MMKMTHWTIVLTFVSSLAGLVGCVTPSPPIADVQEDTALVEDTVGLEDTSLPDSPKNDTVEPVDSLPGVTDTTGAEDTKTPIVYPQVGKNACCLSMANEHIVWAEDGKIFLFNHVTGENVTLIDHPDDATDPVIEGNRIVWADNRSGDYDLWTLVLPDGEPSALLVRPGDQKQPTLSGDLLAWISVEKEPFTDAASDVWAMFISEPGELIQVTNDLSQQIYPHAKGSRIVWTDYRNDPEGFYMPVSNPLENNGDIYGYDLDTMSEFIVTVDPSKQARPVIEGDNVVWLDWRGINPEPKYSEFQVFGTVIDSGLELKLATSAWKRPELWQRPTLDNGLAAWIGEGKQGSFVTGIFVASLDGTPAQLAMESDSTLTAISASKGSIAWLSEQSIGVVSLSDMLKPDESED